MNNKNRKDNIINFINNKKIFIGGLTIFCVFVLSLCLLLDKGSLAVEENITDSITISCPDTAKAGDEIACSIDVEVNTIEANGVSSNYRVTEGLSFVSFDVNDTMVDLLSIEDPNGNPTTFAIVASNITGRVNLGTLKYKIPEDASSNELYKIELINVTIGDGDKTDIILDNSFDEIRILSDINTLDEIQLSSGTLDKEFNKDIKEYNVIVDVDKVVIGAIKTDENSTLGGDVGEVDLHYGTNTFNIIVTSETGIENTYKLNIFRGYKFSSDTYVYNEEENYIYTGTDTLDSEILSNIIVPSDLNASINNNKLIISYSNEKVFEIDIINISSSKYTILDGNVYVEKDLSYSSFIDTLNLNGVDVEVYNDSDKITSGNINEGYKLKVLYDSTLLEEYTFKEEYLNFDNLNIDDENKIIKRLVLNTTYEELMDKITTTGTIIVKDKDGNIVGNNEIVKTGDVIVINLSSGTLEYTVSVLGDLTGDGVANLGDVTVLYRYLKGKGTLELYQIASGDVINNGSIKINDVSRIYRYHKGKISTMEVEDE